MSLHLLDRGEVHTIHREVTGTRSLAATRLSHHVAEPLSVVGAGDAVDEGTDLVGPATVWLVLYDREHMTPVSAERMPARR
jgi:hypothetical protein